MEFTDKDSIPNAQALDESLFKGRQIKVDNELYFNRPNFRSFICA